MPGLVVGCLHLSSWRVEWCWQGSHLGQHKLVFPAGGSFRDLGWPCRGPHGCREAPEGRTWRFARLLNLCVWGFLFLRTDSSFLVLKQFLLKPAMCSSASAACWWSLKGRGSQGQWPPCQLTYSPAGKSSHVLASSKDRIFQSWQLWLHPPSLFKLVLFYWNFCSLIFTKCNLSTSYILKYRVY